MGFIEYYWNPLASPPRGAPGIFSDLLRSGQMPKREWGAESNRKLPHLFIPSRTAAFVPEFAMEDLPLVRIAILVPAFAVNDLPLEEHTDGDMQRDQNKCIQE